MKKISFLHVVIAIGIIVLLFTNKEMIAKNFNKVTGMAPSDGNALNPDAKVMPGGLDYDRQLIAGSRGAEVEQLQKWINQAGYAPPLVVDGIFGIKTTNAVKQYNSGSASITLRRAMEIILAGMNNVNGLF